jgi:hypothetical protein
MASRSGWQKQLHARDYFVFLGWRRFSSSSYVTVTFLGNQTYLLTAARSFGLRPSGALTTCIWSRHRVVFRLWLLKNMFLQTRWGRAGWFFLDRIFSRTPLGIPSL